MHKCPQCQGSGKCGIVISFENDESSIITKCDMCHGAGEINKELYEEVMSPPDIPF